MTAKKIPKSDQSAEQIQELLLDLQRTRADFENYRKRVELDKETARHAGRSGAITKLLPVIDNIERAIAHCPDNLKDNAWAQSVVGLIKQLDKSLEGLDLHRIDAAKGIPFNPELHEAIHFDEADGEHEIIDEELQAGYKLGNHILRPAMVKVTRK